MHQQILTFRNILPTLAHFTESQTMTFTTRAEAEQWTVACVNVLLQTSECE